MDHSSGRRLQAKSSVIERRKGAIKAIFGGLALFFIVPTKPKRSEPITPRNVAGSLYSGCLPFAVIMRRLVEGGSTMKGITLLLVAVVILAGIVAFTVPASLHADDSAGPSS